MAAKSKSDIYLEWDILYDEVQTKKQRDKVINNLLSNIKGNIRSKDETIPLEYKIFKSETNKLLYVLRVYKKNDTPHKSEQANFATRSAMATTALETDPAPSSTPSFSGPIRPSGPPKPPPPGIIITEIN